MAAKFPPELSGRSIFDGAIRENKPERAARYAGMKSLLFGMSRNEGGTAETFSSLIWKQIRDFLR